MGAMVPRTAVGVDLFALALACTRVFFQSPWSSFEEVVFRFKEAIVLAVEGIFFIKAGFHPGVKRGCPTRSGKCLTQHARSPQKAVKGWG